MRADRRTLLKYSVVVAALPLAGTTARATPQLIVFDSRVPESELFAAEITGHRLDLARAYETRWAALRGDLSDWGTVEGLTGWSEWIAVRGVLEAHGLRLRREDHVAAPLSGKANLFRWSMRAREPG